MNTVIKGTKTIAEYKRVREDIRDKIESSLEAIRERAKTAEPQSGFVARRESIMRQEQPKQDAPKIDTAYAEEMARKLSALRSEFVKAMVQSAERTSYRKVIKGKLLKE